MSKLVECVPNFSEGRNKEIIDAVAAAISQTEGCRLLDVDPGTSTNRTVYTFVGSPEAVVNGALNAARVAFEMIDMRKHKGEHPRMGALDVCPFIPVRNVTMAECVSCANVFAEKLSRELKVPVYLYGEAARSESRRALPSVRAGEYEALPTKLKNPEWSPDYGDSVFVPSWGATASGARKFLLAYNINLLTTKELAHRIALNIREGGRGLEQPGRLKKVQAIGWYLQEENMAQVSANLLDYEVTPLHVVYEETRKDAKELGLPVIGSQLVGLIPLQALLRSAEYYIKEENLFMLEEEHKIRLVVNRLGLDALSPFQPRKRIIEYLVQEDSSGTLVTKTVKEFVRSVGARTATPGGGSVSAAVSAMGAALGCMVGQMTYGKRQFESLDGVMRELIPPFYHALDDLLDIVDADSNAFASYMAALKLPKNTDEQQQKRFNALQDGLKEAVGVPLGLAEKVNNLWKPLLELSKHGNAACISDLQVAAKALETGVFGAYFNVLINLREIKDDEFKNQTQNKVNQLLDEAKNNVRFNKMWNPNQGTPYGQPGCPPPACPPQQGPYPGQYPPGTYPGYPGPVQPPPPAYPGGCVPPPCQPGHQPGHHGSHGHHGHGAPGCPPQYPTGYPGGCAPHGGHHGKHKKHKHHGHGHGHHGHGHGKHGSGSSSSSDSD